MKQVLTLLLLIALKSHFFGQCSGCDITVSSSSSTNYNLNNQKICITGGTYTGNINLGNNAELCIGTSANFEGQLNVNGPNSDITNFGNMDFGSLSLNNSSSFTSTGTVNMGNLSLNQNSTADLSNVFEATSVNVNNNSIMTVNGNINFQNTTVNSSGSIMAIGGTLSMDNVNINGTLNTAAITTINGNLIINGSGNATISEQYNVGGNLINNDNFDLLHGGTVGGEFINNSTMTVCGVTNVGGNFFNNGSAAGTTSGGCGGFQVAGNRINNGGATYGVVGEMDICPNFNVQNGTVGASVTVCGPCVNNCGALPVTFLNIKGIINNDICTIYWTTIEETNVSYFEVMSSNDNIPFNTKKHIEPSRYSNKISEYKTQFTINETSKKIYVKIRQHDLNGSFIDSKIIYLEIKDSKFIVFPNPCKNEITLNFGTEKIDGTIAIKNISGNSETQYNIKGQNTITLNTNKLSKGPHLIQLLKKDEVLHYRLIMKQ